MRAEQKKQKQKIDVPEVSAITVSAKNERYVRFALPLPPPDERCCGTQEVFDMGMKPRQRCRTTTTCGGFSRNAGPQVLPPNQQDPMEKAVKSKRYTRTNFSSLIWETSTGIETHAVVLP